MPTAAAEAVIRKQDNDNDKNQQTIVTESAEVHSAPPFPSGVESVLSGVPAAFIPYYDEFDFCVHIFCFSCIRRRVKTEKNI